MKMNEILTEDIQQLEEGPLGKALGTAAVAGALGLAGHGAYKTIDQLSNIDTSHPTKVAQAPAAAKKDLSKIDVPAKKAEPKQKKADSSEYKPFTNSKNEMILAKVAQSSGIKGVELAAFMSQMAHESENFSDMIEDISHERAAKKYGQGKIAKTLGNKSKNDAMRFKGRGYIQLTGRWNYEWMQKELGIDLTSSWTAAQEAAKPEIAAKIAVAFWKKRVQSKVDDFTDVAAVTKPINPGMNGLKDRSNKFDKVMQHMEIEA
jgi:predicted chitinase